MNRADCFFEANFFLRGFLSKLEEALGLLSREDNDSGVLWRYEARF